MKFFPLKTALLCLVMTPVLYTISLAGLQSRLNRLYLDKIRNAMILDSSPLLEGTLPLETLVGRNIRDFLKHDRFLSIAKPDIAIFITTYDGQMIYPEVSPGQDPQTSQGTKELASRNFRILSRGLKTIVEVRLPHGSGIANAVLCLYISISIGVFTYFYRAGSRKAQNDLNKSQAVIRELKHGEEAHKKHLADLKAEKQALFEKMRNLDEQYRVDKKKARTNEEEMFDEILHLEDELTKWKEVEQEKETEIEDLRSRLRKYERRKSTKARRNEYDFLVKRFSALYKHISMNRKAVSGYLSLNEDQQIKAEEVIIQLDRDPDKVIIKRKVFSGKKHKTASFEVLFAYNGRLYFRSLEGGQIEVLVIGTKNTQARDMDFLHSL